MRVFIAVLVLILNLQSWTKADDIRDFEIEGISIGVSLLDYFTEEEIKEGIKNYNYKSKKFKRVELWDAKLNIYDVISVHIKNKDDQYIIYEISGAILFDDNINKCYPKQKKIIKQLSSLFESAEHYDSGRQTHTTVDNESTYDRYDLIFESKATVDITCYNWSDASGFRDHLSIAVNSKEFDVWLSSEGLN